MTGSSIDALTVGAIGLSDFLFNTVPFLARKPPEPAPSVVSSSLSFADSRLRKIDFLRVAVGRLAAGAGIGGVVSWVAASGLGSDFRLAGEGERDEGALESLLLRRLARDLDLRRSFTTAAGRTLAESILEVPSFSDMGGLASCSLFAVTVIFGLLCSSATRS